MGRIELWLTPPDMDDITSVHEILQTIKEFIAEHDHDLKAAWDEKGPRALFDRPKNENKDSLIHYVCRARRLDLAICLLFYDSFCCLLDPEAYTTTLCQSCNFKDPVDSWQHSKLMLAENVHNENALYQALMRLETAKHDETLADIVVAFLESDILEDDTNKFVNKKLGHKKTILHVLIDKEQYKLLKHFIQLYEHHIYEDDPDPPDFAKTDALDRTPLMAALETGNVAICKLVYKKSLFELRKRKDDASKIKKYIMYLESERDELKRKLLRSKLLCVDEWTNQESIKCIDDQYIREIDGRSFESIWLDYVILAKEFNVPVSKRDEDFFMTEDADKQIFINRVNLIMSRRTTLITLIVVNFDKRFSQLDDFVRFLPFNFRLVFSAAVINELEFEFNVKKDLHTIGGENSVVKDPTQRPTARKIYQFVSTKFCPIRDYKSSDEIKEDIDLFRTALDLREEPPKTLAHKWRFFRNLGDGFYFFCKNFHQAFVCYREALAAFPPTFARHYDFVFLEILTRTARSSVLSRSVHNDTVEVNVSHMAADCLDRLYKFEGRFTPREKLIISQWYEISASYEKHGVDQQIALFEKAICLHENDEHAARLHNLIFKTAYATPLFSKYKNHIEDAVQFYETTESSADIKAAAFFNLALAYDKNGDRKKAIENLLKSIELYENFYGDRHYDLANALGTLGLIYKEEEVTHFTARRYVTRALDMYEGIHKCDHPDIAWALKQMGSCKFDTNTCTFSLRTTALWTRGFLMEAYAIYERLIKNNKRIQEDRHGFPLEF